MRRRRDSLMSAADHVLADLSLMATAAIRTSVELRGLGQEGAAEELCVYAEHLREIRTDTAVLLRAGVPTRTESTS